MTKSSTAPASRAHRPHLPALNGRNVRHLTYAHLVARTVKALTTSAAVIGLTIGLGVGLPAYGDALTEAQVIEHEISTRQSFEVPTAAAAVSVERDGYDATEPPQVVWPFAQGTRIASYYGPRTSCASGCSSFHEGVDFDPGAGTSVGSIAAGIVIDINRGNYSALGQHVWIKHNINGQEVISVYAHLQYGSIAVSVGQTVGVGQPVGRVGSTGISTGPHLHLEIHIGGRPINPLPWMEQNASYL
ncbi:MAG TPA: M23 family metallopeptidase [Terrimesophilobacter sp.]|nr:M23 family metallopeptidase [Terrimesophilobacter sp.]HRP99167.1 M23 family metallopeptidase [Terrimesophilobacter sp.]